MKKIIPWTLRLIAGSGGCIALGILISSFLFVQAFERTASDFLKEQVTLEVTETLGKDKAFVLFSKLASAKGFVEKELPRAVEWIITMERERDQEKRQIQRKAFEKTFGPTLTLMKSRAADLETMVRKKYAAVLKALLGDWRIFLGCNALLFGCAFGLSLFRPESLKYNLALTSLLLLSTLLSGAFYIWGTNWFFTILFNDYLGFGYLFFVLLLFSLFCDLAFNRGRLTILVCRLVMAVSSGESPVMDATDAGFDYLEGKENHAIPGWVAVVALIAGYFVTSVLFYQSIRDEKPRGVEAIIIPLEKPANSSAPVSDRDKKRREIQTRMESELPDRGVVDRIGGLLLFLFFGLIFVFPFYVILTFVVFFSNSIFGYPRLLPVDEPPPPASEKKTEKL